MAIEVSAKQIVDAFGGMIQTIIGSSKLGDEVSAPREIRFVAETKNSERFTTLGNVP